MHTETLSRESNHHDTVILCLHGILGSPDHFKRFLSRIPTEWDYYAILLQGHCAGIDDFTHASCEQWRKKIQLTIAQLGKQYSNVIILAHSMGTLYALQEAAAGNPHVKGLILLNVPMIPILRPVFFRYLLRQFVLNLTPEDCYEQAMSDYFKGVPRDRKLYRYLAWIPRAIDLFNEIRRTHHIISDIKIPCRVYLATRDEQISVRSGSLLRANPHIKVSLLKGATHYFYHERHIRQIVRATRTMCEEQRTS